MLVFYSASDGAETQTSFNILTFLNPNLLFLLVNTKKKKKKPHNATVQKQSALKTKQKYLSKISWQGTLDIKQIFKKKHVSLCHSQNEYRRTKLTRKLKMVLHWFLCTSAWIHNLLTASVAFLTTKEKQDRQLREPFCPNFRSPSLSPNPSRLRVRPLIGLKRSGSPGF